MSDSDEELEVEPYEVQFDGDDFKRHYLIKDGRAKASFPNHDKYIGPYKNGLRHGDNGTYFYYQATRLAQRLTESEEDKEIIPTLEDEEEDDDGHKKIKVVYTGQWKEGHRHGIGTMTYPDGSTYTGEWKNGQKHGQGTYTYTSGDKYTGGWENDERSGLGTYLYKHDGTAFTGEWVKSQCSHGDWTFYEQKQFMAIVKDRKVVKYQV